MSDASDNSRATLADLWVARIWSLVLLLVLLGFSLGVWGPIVDERNALQRRVEANARTVHALTTQQQLAADEYNRAVREMLAERVARLVCERDAARARGGGAP